MNKCTFISKRYIKGKKSCLAGSHWLSLFGIVIGVTALLIILSVMNGMRDMVIERILVTSPELEITLNPDDDYQEIYETVSKMSFVKYINPTVKEDLVVFHNNEVILIRFTGIDMDGFKQHSSLFDKIPYTHNFPSKPGLIYGNDDTEFFNKQGIMIGHQLSYTYDINIGDELTAISLSRSEMSSFGKIPLSTNFVVQGVYTNLIPELELSNVFVSASNLKSVNNKSNLYSSLELYGDDFFKANLYKKELAELLPNNKISSWSDKNSNLYNAQKLEKSIMMFVLSLIIILSSFNLTGSFLKKVSNKKREIGILTTIGYTKKNIMNIFLMQGALLGSLGVLCGNLLAIILLYLQLKFNLVAVPQNAIHLFPTLPISIQYSDFILVTLFSLLFSILSSIYPIYRIRNLKPIELIRD